MQVVKWQRLYEQRWMKSCVGHVFWLLNVQPHRADARHQVGLMSKAGSRGLRVALVAIVDDQIRLKSGVKEEIHRTDRRTDLCVLA